MLQFKELLKTTLWIRVLGQNSKSLNSSIRKRYKTNEKFEVLERNLKMYKTPTTKKSRRSRRGIKSISIPQEDSVPENQISIFTAKVSLVKKKSTTIKTPNSASNFKSLESELSKITDVCLSPDAFPPSV